MAFRSEVNSRLNVGMISRAWMVVVAISALWMVSVSATVDFEDNVDSKPWISTRKPGRFLLQDERFGGGRGQNFCGYGRSPNFGCRYLLPPPEFRNPVCCVTRNNDRRCFDVGGNNNNRCGSCTHSCRSGRQCCSGVCEDLLTSPFNCGRCGNRCRRGVTCKNGLCGYNG